MSGEEKNQLPSVIEQPPAYRQADPKRTRKSTAVLSAYAAAVTALLLAALIFGGLMFRKQSQSCSDMKENTTEESKTETKEGEFEDENGEKVHEKVDVDYTKETEVIRLSKNGGRTDNGIVVIDYRRSLTGMYLPEDDQCYLIGGVDHNWKSPFGDNEESEDDGDEKEEVVLREADDYPVLDNSVLPEYLRPYCEGKRTTWLETASQSEMEQTRKKRGYCTRSNCVLRIGWFRRRLRVRCYVRYYRC